MSYVFPEIVGFIGAINFFALTVKLRRFTVSEKPAASRAQLSKEERQRNIVIASWISFACGCTLLIAAILLAWRGHLH